MGPLQSNRSTRLRASLPVSVVAILAFLVGVSGIARAQFNGPPSTADQSMTVPVTTDQSLLFPTTPETLLTAGDVIAVRLFSDPEYNVSVRIAVDGTVLLPLIGTVNLQGVTVSGAERLIADKLEQAGMYRNPQVILQVTEGPSSIVTLSGEMHANVPVVGSRPLFAVIAAGGGLPSGASRSVTILRPGQKTPIEVDIGTDPLHSAASNIPVFPGDTVMVSRIGVIYVMGEFRSPGLVNITNYGPLTLTQVSAMVGGPVFDAKYSETHIIRTVGNHRTVTTLDIKKVLYGKAPDPIMEPNDIVFLPPSAIKASITNGTLGTFLGVLSFAIGAIVTFR